MRARAKQVRIEHRRQVEAALAELKASHTAACARRMDRAKRAGAAQVRALQAEIASSKSYESQVYRAASARQKAKAESAARRLTNNESNQDVERNIAPELVQLWRERAAFTKGSPRKSRTEAFLQWVEEHPDAAAEAISGRVHAEIAALEMTQRKLSKLLAQKRTLTANQLRSVGVNPRDCESVGLDCSHPADLGSYLQSQQPSSASDAPF